MIQPVTHWANWTTATQLGRWGAAEAPPPLPLHVAAPKDEGCTRVGCTRDRTAVLEASLADAQQAERLKDTFLAMASHELRAPLQATLYWAELLRAKPTPALASEAARHIIHNVHVQSRLIDDLLDISRFLNGQLHLEWRRTDPVEVVQKAAEVVRAEASRRGIYIDVQSPPAPVVMTSDPVRLEQVAWNLISNAVHASADGTTVQVRMQATADTFRLEVQDSGVGIEPQDIAQIFETFHRCASSTHQSGLGLGLPITRSIVDQFAGHIQAFSDGPGRGALFTVELPLCGAVEPPST